MPGCLFVHTIIIHFITILFDKKDETNLFFVYIVKKAPHKISQKRILLFLLQMLTVLYNVNLRLGYYVDYQPLVS